MEHTYWLKQAENPLFPDILWSRPESKNGAGRLTIIGGNMHGFSAVGSAYAEALNAGAGAILVVLPDAVSKIVKNILPDANFGPSTPSGSFAQQSLSEFMQSSNIADAVYLCGDFGKNSETAITIEKYIKLSQKLTILSQDVVNFFIDTPQIIIDRKNTILVVSLIQLQAIFIATPSITPITHSMSTQQLAEALHNYCLKHPITIVTKHNDLIFVANNGEVSSTRNTDEGWQIKIGSRASVFSMQNPKKIFESITTCLLE